MPDPNIIGGARPKTLDELIEEQGIAPVTVQELAVLCASWPDGHNPDEMLAFILENRRRHYRPLVHGGSRMTWAAAIVLILVWIAVSIWFGVLLGGLFETSLPPHEASAGLLVGASCFLKG